MSDTIRFFVEIVWIPVVGGLVTLWVKLSGLDTRAKLLEQSEVHFVKMRDEDRERRDQERKELKEQVEKHQTVMITKLDSLQINCRGNTDQKRCQVKTQA